MNRKDLIFDWSEVEAHRGWKGVAVLIVALGFGFSFSLIHVDFDFRKSASVKSASVWYLPDQDTARTWRMIAEEEGPFPGRLEISGEHDVLEEFGSTALIEGDAWNDYEIEMRSLVPDSVVSNHRIAVQGQRYLPKIFKSAPVVTEPGKVASGQKPLLIPYTKESEKWLPAEIPGFQAVTKGEADVSGWRFLLNLDEEGRVAECIAINGGDDDGLAEITAWLKGLQFQQAEEEERWMGLRVELLNQ